MLSKLKQYFKIHLLTFQKFKMCLRRILPSFHYSIIDLIILCWAAGRQKGLVIRQSKWNSFKAICVTQFYNAKLTLITHSFLTKFFCSHFPTENTYYSIWLKYSRLAAGSGFIVLLPGRQFAGHTENYKSWISN